MQDVVLLPKSIPTHSSVPGGQLSVPFSPRHRRVSLIPEKQALKAHLEQVLSKAQSHPGTERVHYVSILDHELNEVQHDDYRSGEPVALRSPFKNSDGEDEDEVMNLAALTYRDDVQMKASQRKQGKEAKSGHGFFKTFMAAYQAKRKLKQFRDLYTSMHEDLSRISKSELEQCFMCKWAYLKI